MERFAGNRAGSWVNEGVAAMTSDTEQPQQQQQGESAAAAAT